MSRQRRWRGIPKRRNGRRVNGRRGRRALLALPLLATPLLSTGCATQPQQIITYSVASIGPIHTSMALFATTAHNVYADGRGWSMYGKIAFKQVPSGGDFTLWLATPDWLPRFSPLCSVWFSCSIGRNVVINEARFDFGPPSYRWPGTLYSYQVMVINHETGHWFGLGHRYCAGYGQLAPVMQQQSISLQGCRANSWPTQPEIAAVAFARGIR